MSKDDYQDMIYFIRDHKDLLSDWEDDFLTSIEERLVHNTKLTEKQIETLDDLMSSARELRRRHRG